MSLANVTAFSDWKDSIYREAIQIMEMFLDGWKYDERESKLYAIAICERVP